MNKKEKVEVRDCLIRVFSKYLTRCLSRYSFFAELIFYLSRVCGCTCLKSQNGHCSHVIEAFPLSGNTKK